MSFRCLIVCGGSGVGLLGQRKVLGMDAELQIDVSRENVVKRWKARDPHAHVIELDQSLGTTGLVLAEAEKRIRGSEDLLPMDRGVSSYVCEGIYEEPHVRHTRFLIDHSPANRALEWGLAQSPSIGGLAIRHPRNRRALLRVFRLMTDGRGLGPDNPVEVWLVSSTAGGTGEGTHRFVAAFLADFLRRNYENVPLTVNFIRVGQLTYRTVNFKRTALSTFLGVAADAAFALKAKKDFRMLTTHWFYVDLPDVGTGERSIKTRARLVEMAAKGVMLEDLQQDLQRLLVNNQGIPMIVTRTGYWGRDFDEERKYYETLRQLRTQLRQLVEPDYAKYVAGQDRSPPRFEAPALEEWIRQVRDVRDVTGRVEDGWRFPGYARRGYPEDLEEVRERVERWKQALEELLDEDMEGLRAEWTVERVVRDEEGEERRETVPLRVSRLEEGQVGREEWFRWVNEAHETLAWSRYLLGCDLQGGKPQARRGGRIYDLLNQAQRIRQTLYGFNPLKGTEARVRDVVGELGEFLQRLVEVDTLLRLEEEARRTLAGALSSARQILEVAESEYNVVRRAVGRGAGEVVIAANLADPLDPATRETWFQLLWGAVRRRDRSLFKEEVLRGATGLTEAGLKEVLVLGAQADIEAIHLELASRMGRMYDPDGNEYEAPWWGANPATGTLEYPFRILPWLDPGLQAQLEAHARKRESEYRYVFTKMGTIGLYVLAFHGVSLTQEEGDTISAPQFLLKPFVPILQQVLERWKDTPEQDRPSGQLTLVLAGVSGEPLYKAAMKAAGLNDEEIEKIGQYYSFYE